MAQVAEAKVLVVDDEESITDLISTALRYVGFDVEIASTAAVVMGKRAPDWLRAHGLAARLVHVDGSIHRLAGWPETGKSKADPTIL